VRLWPTYPDPVSALCAKLTTNVSHQQWRDWVSPNIDYIEACPGPSNRTGWVPLKGVSRVAGVFESFQPG
jgi:hypothetical protein